MTGQELFKTWAPSDSAWSHWSLLRYLLKSRAQMEPLQMVSMYPCRLARGEGEPRECCHCRSSRG